MPGTFQRKDPPISEDHSYDHWSPVSPAESDGYDPAAVAALVPSARSDVYNTLYEWEREQFQDQKVESLYSNLQESPDEKGTFPDDSPDDHESERYPEASSVEPTNENPDEHIYENPDKSIELESASDHLDQESLYAEITEPKKLHPPKHSHEKARPPTTESSPDIRTSRNISYERHSFGHVTPHS